MRSSTTSIFFFFFFNDPATTEIYTLSLHDALPIFHLDARVPTPLHNLNISGGADPPQPRARCRALALDELEREDRKSTRLNSSHPSISYAVFCLKKKKKENHNYLS